MKKILIALLVSGVFSVVSAFAQGDLSVSILEDDLQFGDVELSSSYIKGPIKVTNTGLDYTDWRISGADSWMWSLSGLIGPEDPLERDVAHLMAVLSSTTTELSGVMEYDWKQEDTVLHDVYKYMFEGDGYFFNADGNNVPPGESRYLWLKARTPPATRRDDETSFTVTIIADLGFPPEGFTFDDTVQGWEVTYGPAITEVGHDTITVRDVGSLECVVVDLASGSNTEGEAGFFFPETGTIDLSTATVSVWLYISSDLQAATGANGIQLLFKDGSWDSKYSSWNNIGPSGLVTDEWVELTVDMENEVWGLDDGADLTDVRQVGIKIGAGDDETPLSGSFYIDSFKWE